MDVKSNIARTLSNVTDRGKTLLSINVKQQKRRVVNLLKYNIYIKFVHFCNILPCNYKPRLSVQNSKDFMDSIISKRILLYCFSDFSFFCNSLT